MNGRIVIRIVVGGALGAGLVLFGPPDARPANAGLPSFRSVDPATVVPLDQIAPGQREQIAEVIREANFRQQGKTDTFPANPRIYLTLLNEPVLTLSLWRDLAPTPANLRPTVDPSRYEGDDGNGTRAVWEYVLRSPRLHVLLCTLDYIGPRGHPRLAGRIVLVVNTAFFKEPDGEPWVRHTVEAFVKIDTRGWKAIAATVRPLIEKLLEDQIQEAGWFVSLMARLVEMYPNWAVSVALTQPLLPDQTRRGFRDLVAQTRRPGALPGRPQMISEAQAAATAPDQLRR